MMMIRSQFLHERILRTSGFSLIEVLVAAAILSGIALILVTIMTHASKAQKGVQESQAVQEMVNTINLILNHNERCSEFFGSIIIQETQFNQATEVQPLFLSELKIPNKTGTSAALIAKENSPLSGESGLWVPTKGIALEMISPLLNVAGKPKIVTQIIDSQEFYYHLYAAQLTVQIEKKAATAATSSFGSPKFIRKFRMVVGFNQAQPNHPLEYCPSASVDFTNPLIKYGVSCGEGQALKGIKAGGAADCVALASGTVGTPGKDGKTETPTSFGGYRPNMGPIEISVYWKGNNELGYRWQAKTDDRGNVYLRMYNNAPYSDHSWGAWKQTSSESFHGSPSTDPANGLRLNLNYIVTSLVYCVPTSCSVPWGN